MRYKFNGLSVSSLMVLKGVYIIPHGDEIIDLPSDGSRKIRKEIERIAREDSSGTLIIISPHGLRLRRYISLINTERLFSVVKTQKYELKNIYETDRKLASAILDEEKEYVEEVQFVTSSGDLSSFPVDFGTAIPLVFFGKRKVIAMGQLRTNNRNFLERFGENLAKLAQNYPGDISIILSADQAHAHSADGPYGYSEKAKEYDSIIVDTIETSRYDRLSLISDEFIADAKPDSYWNMLILKGIVEQKNIKMKLLYYYVERYFGMLAARND